MPFYELLETIEAIATTEATEAQRRQYQTQLATFQARVQQTKTARDRAQAQYATALKALNDFKARNAQLTADAPDTPAPAQGSRTTPAPTPPVGPQSLR